MDFEPETLVSDLSIGPAPAAGDHQGAVARCAAHHHGRADLEPDRCRRPTACCEVIADLNAKGVSIIFISHRLNEVERMRRPRHRAARRRRSSAVSRRTRSRTMRDDPADDRARPQIALSAAGRAARRANVLEIDRGCAPTAYPDRTVSLHVRARRNPGPCRPDRRRPHGTGARHLRHRPMLGGGISLDGAAGRYPDAARRHRARHLSGARGPQAVPACCSTSPSPRTSRCPICRAIPRPTVVQAIAKRANAEAPEGAACASRRRR